MVVEVSTTASLSALAVTFSLSRPTTATWENRLPAGFQHLVQPHTWLCATWLWISTITGLVAQRQVSVPPEKFGAAGWMPLSTAGWIFTLLPISLSLLMFSLPGWLFETLAQSVQHHRADRLPALHQFKPFVDALERQGMRDQVVDIDLAVHVPVD